MSLFFKDKDRGYATKISEIPKTSHFVIIHNSSYYDCDEDGMNGVHMPKLDYQWFNFIEDWEAEIKDLINKGNTNFLPMKVTPAKVTTVVSTNVEIL